MKKIPIILDCDPGHDDAIAIMLAVASDVIDIKGITTVGGNQTIQKTTDNALRVLEFIGADIEVAMGADTPLRRELEIAPEVHGETGMDGPVIPATTRKPLDMLATDFMAKIIEESEEKITLVATGPLTNVAIFLLAYPHLKERIERISIMGGSAFRGNWSNAAEFNILVDPEAAAIVFGSGIPIAMAGLDVTHRAGVYEEDIVKIKALNGKVAIFIGELLDYFSKYHRETCEWDFAPLHDPCAVAYLINPEMFTVKKAFVTVDLDGEHTTGSTVTDFAGISRKEKNVEVLVDIDRKAMIDLVLECARKLDGGMHDE